MKALLAEFFGTALLIIGGCGAAIFGFQNFGILGTAVAFGLSLVLVAYLFGPVSGGHVNPAVTIALALSGNFAWGRVPAYIVAQILGGLLGAGLLRLSVLWLGDLSDNIMQAGFATNTLNEGVTLASGATIEVVMTAILVMVVLATTRASWNAVATPIALGVVLMLVHIVSIPFTNTSVNPARSIGVSLVSGNNINELWIFILFPIVGAVLGYFVYRVSAKTD